LGRCYYIILQFSSALLRGPPLCQELRIAAADEGLMSINSSRPGKVVDAGHGGVNGGCEEIRTRLRRLRKRVVQHSDRAKENRGPTTQWAGAAWFRLWKIAVPGSPGRESGAAVSKRIHAVGVPLQCH